MTPTKRYLLSTPIYYVNGSPHFAHAYTTTCCDVIARWQRLEGLHVHFVTGTDEHGQKVARAAQARGVEPLAYCNAVSNEFREMNRLMNISHDDFIRTTEPRHHEAVQALWRTLEANGQIYEGDFTGWYAVRDEAWVDESEIVDGKAPSGAPVELTSERNFFFRLSEYQERLLQLYAENPGFIMPASRRQEVESFVRGGLRDLSISRTSFSWGIPVPNHTGHVTYVWLDALTNYLTTTGYPDRAEATTSWPADLHLVGKDIIRFHCVYWPAFLMAAGLPLPARVFAHGWWTVDGEKMSKSSDNFIPPARLAERYGVDGLRYFMVRELTFGADGDLSESALHRRIVGELTNEFGNLVHRTLTMVQRYRSGRVPQPSMMAPQDKVLLEAAARMLPAARAHMADQALQAMTQVLWSVVSAANRYVQAEAPWALARAEDPRLDTVLYVLLETLRRLGLLLQPIVPEAAERLLGLLAVGHDARQFAAFDLALAPGTRLPTPEILFPRRDLEMAAAPMA